MKKLDDAEIVGFWSSFVNAKNPLSLVLVRAFCYFNFSKFYPFKFKT